jgi:uncharacterized protein YlaN (UPF0358 family)
MIPLFAVLKAVPLKFWAGGAIALVAALYVGALKIEIYGLENDVKTKSNEIGRLEILIEKERGKVLACNSKIDVTNERIADLKDDSDSRSEIISLLSDNITMFREVTKLKVSEIESQPTPENCKQAMDFLRKGIGK